MSPRRVSDAWLIGTGSALLAVAMVVAVRGRGESAREATQAAGGRRSGDTEAAATSRASSANSAAAEPRPADVARPRVASAPFDETADRAAAPLEPHLQRYLVRVVDADGTPIAGHQVHAVAVGDDGRDLPRTYGPEARWRLQEATLDAEGRVRLDVPRDVRFRLSGDARPGASNFTTEPARIDGDTAICVVPGPVTALRFRTVEGEPVADVQIPLGLVGRAKGHADGEGNCLVRGVAGDDFTIHGPALVWSDPLSVVAASWAVVSVSTGDETFPEWATSAIGARVRVGGTARILLAREFRFQGRVVENGHGVPEVRCVVRSEPGGCELGRTERQATGADGLFRGFLTASSLEKAQADGARELVFDVQSPDGRRLRTERRYLPLKTDVDLGDLPVEPLAWIIVRVVDEDGTAAPFLAVRRKPGAFDAFDYPGAYSEFLRDAPAKESAQRLLVSSPPTWMLRRRGCEAAILTAALGGPRGAEPEAVVTLRRTGRLVLKTPEGAPGVRVVFDGEPPPIAARCDQGLTVTPGPVRRVVLAGGAGPTGSADFPPGMRLRCRVEHDLSDDRYVWRDGRRSEVKPFLAEGPWKEIAPLASGESRELALAVPEPPIPVIVRVVDADGAPAPSAWVELERDGDARGGARQGAAALLGAASPGRIVARAFRGAASAEVVADVAPPRCDVVVTMPRERVAQLRLELPEGAEGGVWATAYADGWTVTPTVTRDGRRWIASVVAREGDAVEFELNAFGAVRRFDAPPGVDVVDAQTPPVGRLVLSAAPVGEARTLRWTVRRGGDLVAVHHVERELSEDQALAEPPLALVPGAYEVTLERLRRFAEPASEELGRRWIDVEAGKTVSAGF
ncbi:MAG TPA: hypothetical protein VEI02_04280 [Planctomycetota bacterium]|nr:hypothetical protein [Planctomycetota bacterium]